MKKTVVMCGLLLGVVLGMPLAKAQRAAEAASPFTQAERFGEEKERERTFFVFSTSAGKYILRHDGVGEVTSPAGLRKVFNLKVGVKERIERVYLWEYGGDLLLLYQAGEAGYLARMNQRSRKVRTMTIAPDFTPPAFKEHRLVFDDGTTVSVN